MNFHEAKPEDESYWWVKDEDGEATVVYIEYVEHKEKIAVKKNTPVDNISEFNSEDKKYKIIKRIKYEASYTGVEGFYDATTLEFLGKALQDFVLPVKKLIVPAVGVTDNDLLYGRHFQETLSDVLDGTETKSNERLLVEALNKLVPVGTSIEEAKQILHNTFEQAEKYLQWVKDGGKYEVICETQEKNFEF